MSLSNLRRLTGAYELMKICMIENQEERIAAVDRWLKRRVKDYHVQISIDKAYMEQLKPIEYAECLEEERKRAAYEMGSLMLKHQGITSTQLFPSEEEKELHQGRFNWWEFEERHQLDCNVFFNLY